MTRRWLLILVALNLAALLGLAVAYPHWMVSPGPLVQAHADLTTDCFACHAPLRGASAQRCITCHAVADIGLRTTRGTPVAGKPGRPAFHQSLIEQDCMACHIDHLGTRQARAGQRAFSHALLQVAVRERCESCHRPPADTLHRTIRDNCTQCHGQKAWKPATFDHAKLFVLDRDHDTACTTCHKAADYRQYTCYGCHEHSEAKVRAEHEEEGIADFADCVRCHRDPGVEPRKEGRSGGSDGQRRKKRD
jgi:hypothetical protein